MLGKHPLELTRERKLSREEVAEALRLSIIAELDAINLYLQLARYIEDEGIRRVFEDIAREEKTHVGEFLELLKRLDKEQVEELERGAREVAEITGVKTTSTNNTQSESREREDIEDLVRNYVREVAKSNRIIVPKLPVTRLGRGVDVVPLEIVRNGVIERRVIQLVELSERFKVSQRSIDAYKTRADQLDAPDAYRAARQLVTVEEKLVYETLRGSGQVRVEMRDWSQPGHSVEDVARAVIEVVKNGGVKPLVLIVNPVDYVKLLAVDVKTGLTDLERVKSLVDDVLYTPVVPEGEALVLSTSRDVLDVVYGGDTEVDYIGPEDGYHAFRVWSTIAIRVKNPGAIAILKRSG